MTNPSRNWNPVRYVPAEQASPPPGMRRAEIERLYPVLTIAPIRTPAEEFRAGMARLTVENLRGGR